MQRLPRQGAGGQSADRIRARHAAERAAVPQIEFLEGIKGIRYERCTHRRWKIGILVSGRFLRSTANEHWLAFVLADSEGVFQLSKQKLLKVNKAVKSSTGITVKMSVRRG